MEQQFNIAANSKGEAEYKIWIPLEDHDLSSNENSNSYTLKIREGDDEILVRIENNEFMVQSKHKPGKYLYKISLLLNNNIIEKKDVLVTINERLSTEPNIDKGVRNKLLEFDLKKKSFSSYGGTGYRIEYEDSITIYKEIRKEFGKKPIDVLCNIIGNRDEDFMIAYKAILVLKHYRSPEGLKYIGVLFQREFKEDSTYTKGFYDTCMEYINEMSGIIKLKNDVEDLYLHIINSCNISWVQEGAILGYYRRNTSSKDHIETLLKITNENSNNRLRVKALSCLQDSDISGYVDNFSEWFEDIDQSFRLGASRLGLKYSNKFDFTEIQKLYEFEPNEQIKTYFGQILLNNNLNNAEKYFFALLEEYDEFLIASVLNIFISSKHSFTKEKILNIKKILAKESYSSNTQKKIDDFYKKINEA